MATEEIEKPVMPLTDADIWGEPGCEVSDCLFLASMNLQGKWVCVHHAPAEASYIKKYGKPYRKPELAAK